MPIRLASGHRWLQLLRGISFFLVAVTLCPPSHAQGRGSALSNAEVEELRNVADAPSERILTFIRFVDDRVKSIQGLYAKSRRPGREQDTHDLLEQITLVSDELGDNLDDYGPRHYDIRKALPRLIDATDRWSSAIKSPPDNAAYDVSRSLTLESIKDLRDTADQLVEEQKAWFLVHPPKKENVKKKDADQ